jgi:hypothetical protein
MMATVQVVRGLTRTEAERPPKLRSGRRLPWAVAFRS